MDIAISETYSWLPRTGIAQKTVTIPNNSNVIQPIKHHSIIHLIPRHEALKLNCVAGDWIAQINIPYRWHSIDNNKYNHCIKCTSEILSYNIDADDTVRMRLTTNKGSYPFEGDGSQRLLKLKHLFKVLRMSPLLLVFPMFPLV